MPEPDTFLERFIALGSVEAIAQEMDSRQASWSAARGEEAKLAVLVLTLRKVEAAVTELTGAVRRMDRASNRLQLGALLLGALSVVVGVVVPLTT